MSRIFAYCRVSTFDQTTENQLQEICYGRIQGGPKAGDRGDRVQVGSDEGAPRFLQVVGQDGGDDVLVVTKLVRLGRNAMDVRLTVEALQGIGVRLHSLALGGVDVTSAAGKMLMQVLAAFA